MSQSGPHDEFLELCTASITGELTDQEQKRLGEHLAVCEPCREAFRQYQAIAQDVIPAVAASSSSDSVKEDGAWSQGKAEKALFERLGREGKRPHSGSRVSPSSFADRIFPFAGESAWRNVWMLYAAGLLLFCAIGFFAYRLGMHRSVASAPNPQPAEQESASARSSLEEQLSDAGHDRAVANAEVAQRDRTIAGLRRQLTLESAEIEELKAAQNRLENRLRAGDANREELNRQKNELAEKLESAQQSSRSLQERLDTLAEQSASDAAVAKLSDAKVTELTQQIQKQQAALAERDDLLAHDRDIREVMGARDLYIAEIYDVSGTGETKKPYGRVFYTRGKSLIFYAYDLDQQTGLKRASTFQAWGRRGPDQKQAVNLGVFYEDNAGKKRWILKCDDSKTLAHIDAVFVTVEPNGGSDKPSSKTLLFAYLKVNPNHP